MREATTTTAYCDSRARARAFTLIEVIVAGFVLTIAVLGFSAAMPAATKLNDGARSKVQVSEIINSKFAEIAATPFAEAASTYHLTGFEIPGLTPDPEDDDGLPGEIVFAAGPDGLAEVYSITFRVRWQSGGSVRTVEAQRLLGNVRGEQGSPPSLSAIGTG